MNIDIGFWMMASIVIGVLVAGWRRLPGKLAVAHQAFRDSGVTEVYRELNGAQLVLAGLSLDVSRCKFASEATFSLLPPILSSKGMAAIDGNGGLRVRAETRWPSMKSVLILDDGSE